MTEQELAGFKWYCDNIIDWRTGAVCGCRYFEVIPKGPHQDIVCADCGRHIDYLKKPKNENKRNCNNNAVFMDRHREQGPLICWWCGISEKDWPGGFECDHIIQVSDGGPDVFENTRPLCKACHDERHVQVRRIKIMLGASK